MPTCEPQHPMPGTTSPEQSTTTRDDERRRQAAASWLQRLGQAPTPERVEALSQVVTRYRPGTFKYRIASQLLACGEHPSPELVQARIDQIHAESRQLRAEAQQLIDKAPDLLDWLRRYVHEHGEGPTWSTIRQDRGWTSAQTNAVLHLLRKQGWVTFTREPHSLRPVLGDDQQAPKPDCRRG